MLCGGRGVAEVSICVHARVRAREGHTVWGQGGKYTPPPTIHATQKRTQHGGLSLQVG
jgi:hypothetical protein